MESSWRSWRRHRPSSAALLARPMTRNAMAMRWSRWVATGCAAAWHLAVGRERSGRRLRSRMGRRVGRDLRRRPRAGRIPSPATHAGPASASCPRQRRPRRPGSGYSSIIAGARGGRDVDAVQAARRTRRSATVSPPSLALVQALDRSAHFEQGRDQPGAERIHHHGFDHHVRAGRDEGRHQRKGRRGRIRRHHDLGALRSAGPEA